MRVPGVMDAFSLARCVRVPEERLCTNAAVPGYAVADGRRGTSVRTIGNGKAFGRRCCTFASDVCTDPTPDLYLLNASMVRLSPGVEAAAMAVDRALRVTVSVSSRRIAIVLSRVITESFSHFCIIYVRFGGASDPLAHNSAPLITLPEAGVSLVGGTHMMIEPYFASGDNVDNGMPDLLPTDTNSSCKSHSGSLCQPFHFSLRNPEVAASHPVYSYNSFMFNGSQRGPRSATSRGDDVLLPREDDRGRV
ncbi:hypothetical protein MRX96_019895 [Rhipicephalus microplus]